MHGTERVGRAASSHRTLLLEKTAISDVWMLRMNSLSGSIRIDEVIAVGPEVAVDD